jgi:hypothetical protein
MMQQLAEQFGTVVNLEGSKGTLDNPKSRRYVAVGE